MATADFYREQAALQRAALALATLENVREGCRRAAKAWDALAADHDRVEALRLERAAAAVGRGVSTAP